MKKLILLIALCLYGCDDGSVRLPASEVGFRFSGHKIICDEITGIAYLLNYPQGGKVITPYYDSDRMPMKCEKLKDIYGSHRRN